ncbi:hypothetical protein [Fodinibius sp.]|uniref:hypothetical protein n=1 Tax=Fodinibius sp. TaxID=1872440 RepID=UPI002ACD2B89|nr:hypothetical protein [Fodinibius sp.]
MSYYKFMFKKFTFLIGITSLIIFLGVIDSNAQGELEQFANEGIIKVAEPGQLADTLNLWGDVRNPGRYMVPQGTSITDLISYARGPVVNTEERRVLGIEAFVLRYSPENEREIVNVFRFKPNEPLPREMRNFVLQNNDTITIKVHRKRTFIQAVRNVTPFLTLIISGIIAYDRIVNN